MAKSSNVSFDIPTTAKAIGQSIVDLQVAVIKTVDLTKTLQEHADKLRANGVKMGKSIKTCTWRATISDTINHLAKEKTAKKTCMNYMTSFVNAVNNGTKFSLSSSKGAAKNGKKSEKAKVAIDSIVGKLYNHEAFLEFAAQIQAAYDDAKADTLAACIEDYLREQGFQFDDEK